jgi:lipase chaperone LimK
LINFEKKQLMVQWKTALVNLTKRDEAVAAAKDSVNKAKDEIRDLQADLLGTRREIAAAQNSNEVGLNYMCISTRNINNKQTNIIYGCPCFNVYMQ